MPQTPPTNPLDAINALKQLAANAQKPPQMPQKPEPEKACAILGVVGGTWHTCIKEKCKFWDSELEPAECRFVNACDILFDLAAMANGLGEIVGQLDLAKLIEGIPQPGQATKEEKDAIEEETI